MAWRSLLLMGYLRGVAWGDATAGLPGYEAPLGCVGRSSRPAWQRTFQAYGERVQAG